MALTGTTAITTSTYATILADTIIQEMRPAQFMRPHFRQGTPGASLSFDFQIFDSSTQVNFLSGTNQTTAATQGVAPTPVAVTTTKQTATASVRVIDVEIPDLAQAVSTLDVRAEASAMLQRIMLHKWEIDATANLANFSNTTTAASSQLSYDDVLAAIAALEQRDAATGYVGGFHPKQLADVRTDIAGRTGTIFAKESGPNDFQGHYRETWEPIAGVPMFASTTVSSAAGNFQGAVFTDQEALGYLELWGLKVEPWRDPRALETFVVVSMAYGSVEIDDLRGQTVLSSTS